MKRLFSVLLFLCFSVLTFAQGEDGPKYTKKYFVSTNSGIKTTPVGFRAGFLDRRGGYIAARFGRGNKYRYDGSVNQTQKWFASKGTLFSATVGLILPVFH